MAGIDKGTMIDAEYWRRLWDTFGDQCGGIRSIRMGSGLEITFDPPIARGSFAVPEDFPHTRSDGGDVYVFGVRSPASARPGASGGATGAYAATIPADGKPHAIPRVEEDRSVPAIAIGRGYATFAEPQKRRRYDD